MKKLTRRNLEKFLEKYQTKGEVLDVGSGGSSYDRFFPNRVTVDIDPEREPQIIASAEELPFPEESFETILCTEVLEHVTNPPKVLKEFNRVLKKGGHVILTTRFVYPLHDIPNDYWRFTEFGLKHLFHEWEIVEFVSENNTFSTIAVLLQRISFQTILKGNKLSKLFLYLFTKLFDNANWLIVKEYGDIKRNNRATNILTSGYYIVAKKIK